MMNNAEKIITMIVALVGGCAGLWGAYTAHDSSKFTQPFDEREQMVKSFTNQITYAEKRKDEIEVNRLSLLLESYEESWRSARLLAKLVAPVENLATTKIGNAESQNIQSLLDSLSSSASGISISHKTLGAAYYTTGNFKEAIDQLNLATLGVNDPSTNVLKAAAYANLANLEPDQDTALFYRESAFDSFITAQNGAHDKVNKIALFAASNNELKKLLEGRGVELTRQ